MPSAETDGPERLYQMPLFSSAEKSPVGKLKFDFSHMRSVFPITLCSRSLSKRRSKGGNAEELSDIR